MSGWDKRPLLRQVFWSSQTAGQGTAPYTLRVRAGGNAMLQDGLGSVLWATSKTALLSGQSLQGMPMRQLPQLS